MELKPLSEYNYFGNAIVGRRETGDLGGSAFLTDPFHFTSGYSISTLNTSSLTAANVNQVLVNHLPDKFLPCKVATTNNITLSGTQTVDGVPLVAGDRVLVRSQTASSQNGIYYVASGAWYRSAYSYFGVPAESIVTGKYAKIISGNTYAGKWAVANVDSYFYLETSPVLFDIISEDCVELQEKRNYYLRFKNIGTLKRTYFFSVVSGQSIRAATTENITLSGLQTIDGITLIAGNKVLVKNQNSGSFGVYTVASGSWTLFASLSNSKFYFISEGNDNGGKTFVLSEDTPPVVQALSMILYPTLEDAINETNSIIPLYTTSFRVNWIFKNYIISECSELGAQNVGDVLCCPPPEPFDLVMPPTLTLTMANAKFVTEVGDISLGNIETTLTFDAASGYYFGPLENYYNIPGRLHAQVKKADGSNDPVLFDDQGWNSGSLHKWAGIGLKHVNVTFDIIGGNQNMYYSPSFGTVDADPPTPFAGPFFIDFNSDSYYAGSIENVRVFIRYSAWKRARKGAVSSGTDRYFDFTYDYTLEPYGNSNDSTINQTHNFFNSNRYWVESSSVTIVSSD
ncbi:MAG: hypothetical protein EBU46_11505, partial [Nitrosomonadaceae bacterium]|nr:hypothetical protein [Nitrosomonadaceae bacterium]